MQGHLANTVQLGSTVDDLPFLAGIVSDVSLHYSPAGLELLGRLAPDIPATFGPRPGQGCCRMRSSPSECCILLRSASPQGISSLAMQFRRRQLGATS